MLLVFNKTGAAVTLAAGNPVRSIPASSAPPARGPAVDCTSELRGLSGANYVALQAQSASLDFMWTADPEYATTGLTVDGPSPGIHAATHKTAGGTDVLVIASTTTTEAAQTPNVTAEVRPGCVYYTAPVAEELISIVADVAMANGPQIIAGQPDYPRKLTVRITDADSSVSAGTVTIVGVGASGQALSDVVTLTGGTATKYTANAFATVTSATIAALAGAAAADHISIGQSSALGLPGTRTPTPSAFAVHKAMLNDANEAVGTVDATAGTIIPTTAPNAARNYRFFYTYTVAGTTAAHTHTHSAHAHNIT